MTTKVFAPIIILCSLAVAACGGGGGSDDSAAEGIAYTGSRSPASVDAANAEALAIASTGGTNQAIAADTANNASPISPKGAAANSNLVSKIVTQLQNLAAAGNRSANQAIPGLCDAGTAELAQNSAGTQGTIVFIDCLVSGGNGEVVNGTVAFSGTVSNSTITSLDIRFIDFTVTHLGETHTVNMMVACSGVPLTCTLSSDFVGLDGRIYRVEIEAVTNIAGTAFDVNATVFDPDHGFVTIDASIAYNDCPGGVPESGAITISDTSANPTSVTFNDCDSFTVTHMGVPTVYFWTDIL